MAALGTRRTGNKRERIREKERERGARVTRPRATLTVPDLNTLHQIKHPLMRPWVAVSAYGMQLIHMRARRHTHITNHSQPTYLVNCWQSLYKTWNLEGCILRSRPVNEETSCSHAGINSSKFISVVLSGLHTTQECTKKAHSSSFSCTHRLLRLCLRLYPLHPFCLLLPLLPASSPSLARCLFGQ